MLRNAAEYSPPRRGGVDAPSIKWIRSEIGAAGVVSSAKLFRPKHFAELTTPPAASFGGFATFIDAAAFPSSARRGISRTQLLANSFTPSMSADSPRIWRSPAVIEDVNELRWCVIPLLHHRKEGWLRRPKNVAKPPKLMQPGWFSFCSQSENHPGLAFSGGFAAFC